MTKNIYTVDDIKRITAPVLRKYSVEKAVLFGSYGKGCATEQSDIDLLVYSSLKGLQFVGFIEDMRVALKKDVDVFNVTHIIPKSAISDEIQKTGVVIYEA